MKIYEVGGAVRDELLGLEVKERDYLVVGATATQMLDLGYRQVGRDFPVFLHPETQAEYALARLERKTGSGHTAFAVNAGADVSLEDDLRRRDITINAIARDADGKLHDPYGGRRDLQARVLRHVSAAFAEDPLRVLRVARFAARFHGLGFTVADETLALMQTVSASGELATLSAERIWVETEKALNTAYPRIYFETLRACGALAAIFPELDRLFGVPQPQKWHPEIDTGLHTWLSLDRAAELTADPVVRFAVLVHDLGKGTTPADLLPRHHGHEQRSVRLIMQLGDRLRIPKRFLALALVVARFHGVAHRATEMRPVKLLEVLTAMGAMRDPAVLDRFVIACTADIRGRTGLETSAYPQGDYLRRALQAALGVSAADVAAEGLEGEAFGQALAQQRVAAIRAATADQSP